MAIVIYLYFVNIKINKICKDNAIDSGNVLTGKASDENIRNSQTKLDKGNNKKKKENLNRDKCQNL